MIRSMRSQTYWSLRTDIVNPCDTALLPPPPSTMNQRTVHELITYPGRPSFTCPLKMLCWNPAESSGFFSPNCPELLSWCPAINVALPFTTAWRQGIGFTAWGPVDPSLVRYHPQSGLEASPSLHSSACAIIWMFYYIFLYYFIQMSVREACISNTI